VLLAGATAAGCGETVEQKGARLAVQLYARGQGRSGDTRCTSSPRLFFAAGPRAKVFVCIVKTAGARCDRYIAYRSGRDYTVRLHRRDDDCILPAG
jgi:hypothetical protein